MAGISYRTIPLAIINSLKFNRGTELNSTFDISLYETQFRSLDPQIGRFWQIDQLTDVAVSNSPFSFGNDNPLTFNDPLGLLSDSSHPKEMNTIVIHSKRAIPKSFMPYISFPNGHGFSIASRNDWPLTFSRDRTNDLLDSWAMGLGAENRVYLPEHKMTQRLLNSRQMELARAFFYTKYLTDYKNGLSLKGASVTQLNFGFGIPGIFNAGTDLVEQFVGSMTIDIHVDSKGENLLFVVSNTTGKKSAYYHLATDIERVPGQLTPQGNFNQIYLWKEPIKSISFLQAELGGSYPTD